MINNYRYKKQINGVEYESTLHVMQEKVYVMPYSAISWENGYGGYVRAENGDEASTVGTLANGAISQAKTAEKQQEQSQERE